MQSYPNPHRQGCPDDATICNFARNPGNIKAEHETDKQGTWYHITHCSPCYASFLKLRNAGRERKHGRERENE